jgi:hypothetical protein
MQNDDAYCWIAWTLDAESPIDREELHRLESELRREGVEISFAVRKGTTLEMKVAKTLPADHAELYDASLNAIHYLEMRYGRLHRIELQPRSRWERQFVLAKRFGALG